jgi:hypothetical protein
MSITPCFGQAYILYLPVKYNELTTLQRDYTHPMEINPALNNWFQIRWTLLIGVLLFHWLAAGCVPNRLDTPTQTATDLPVMQFTSSSTAITTLTPTITNLPTTTPAPTETATPEWREPGGCLKPGDDYSVVSVNGWKLNQRTLDMLKQASQLYSGPIDITNTAITQGSYHDNGAASFGTHLGGGAIDLSVISIYRYEILTDEIEPLIHALRVAGFAAWYREPGAVYDGSPPHIHAIAIGDEQLSDEAQLQLTGPAGYFRGFDGLPSGNNPPAVDPHGGPVLCQWMLDDGYTLMEALQP